VSGRIIYRGQLTDDDGDESYGYLQACTAMIQLPKGETVPSTAESAFSEFREQLMENGKYGNQNYEGHGFFGASWYPEIDKHLRELMEFKLLPTEANDKQKKLIEALDNKIG